MVLGAVDVGPGGAVDHEVVGADRRAHRVAVGHVELGAREAHRGPLRGGAHHVLAEHSARACHDEPHRIWTSALSPTTKR